VGAPMVAPFRLLLSYLKHKTLGMPNIIILLAPAATGA